MSLTLVSVVCRRIVPAPRNSAQELQKIIYLLGIIDKDWSAARPISDEFLTFDCPGRSETVLVTSAHGPRSPLDVFTILGRYSLRDKGAERQSQWVKIFLATICLHLALVQIAWAGQSEEAHQESEASVNSMGARLVYSRHHSQ